MLSSSSSSGQCSQVPLLWAVLSSSSSSVFSHTLTVATFDLSPPEIEMDNENLPPGAERLTRHFRAMPDTLLTASGDWRFRTDPGAKFGRSLAARYV